jgi:cell division topological specificity factor
VIEFLKRLFGYQGSSATAKERLRLVLMTDHLELAPEMIEQMKRDLVEVISRHVEVDRERIDVTFERQDSTLAMLANIPILAVNRPNGNGSAKLEEPVEAVAASPKAKRTSAPKSTATASSKPTADAQTPPTRKRRRRKKAKTVPSAATA